MTIQTEAESDLSDGEWLGLDQETGEPCVGLEDVPSPVFPIPPPTAITTTTAPQEEEEEEEEEEEGGEEEKARSVPPPRPPSTTPPASAFHVSPEAHADARLITKHRDRRRLHGLLNRTWGVAADSAYSRSERSLCPMPVQVSRASLRVMRQEPYALAEKTDGKRRLLWFTQVDGQEHAYLVNRQRHFVQLRISAPIFLFRGRGTLLDCELVRETGGQFKLLAFDIMRVGGQSLMRRNYLARMCEVKRMLAESDLVLPGGVAVEPKPVYYLADIRVLLRRREDLPHPSDGLIFTPINAAVTTRTARHTYKYKEQPSVDLWVTQPEGRGPLQLSTFEHSDPATGEAQLVPCSSVERIASLGRLSAPPRASLPVQLQLPCLIEFDVLPEQRKTGPLCKRRFPLRFFRSRKGDKTRPNHAHTVASIMQEVRESLTLREIVTSTSRWESNVLRGVRPMRARELSKRAEFPSGREVPAWSVRAQKKRKAAQEKASREREEAVEAPKKKRAKVAA